MIVRITRLLYDAHANTIQTVKKELNDLLTQVGPGTGCGALMRQYWQPVALVDEFDPALDPRMAKRPVKAVRALGQDFVLFQNAPSADGSITYGLLDRDCPHRGADLSFARYEITVDSAGQSQTGIRCPFHGWKFDASGQCLETPAEPEGSTLCTRIQQRSYPVKEKSGVLFAWLGEPDKAPPFPSFDCFAAPATHTFAFKGLWQANWLQAFEVGIDPAHPSFLHRFFNDAALDEVGDNAGGKQFRSASAGDVDGQHWPMTRVMRELHRPVISSEPTPSGMRLTALRQLSDTTMHVRVTNAIFPHTFVIPLSETMTISQMHLPVDDTHTYWYSIFTSYGGPVDKEAMRAQRLQYITLPNYEPKAGHHNAWGFNAAEQQTSTYLGMGEDDINVHDQWAVESMGAVQDRTREHLGTSDKAIMANRRVLQKAIEAVAAGGAAPFAADTTQAAHMTGPDTIDGFAPAATWQDWWQTQADKKRAAAPWANHFVDKYKHPQT
jgi:phthalate 4,5-dioxygenase